MTSSTSPATNYPKFGSVLATVAITLLLASCQAEPETDSKSESVDEPISETQGLDAQGSSVASVDDVELPEQAADALLGDGFYTEDQGQKVSGLEEVNSPNEQNQALVEGAGFSDVTEEPQVQAVKQPRYCQQEAPVEVVTAAEACDRISTRLASVSKSSCNSALLEPSQCRSVGGFPIFLREFAPIDDRDAQGRILVVGGIHGDELTSVSIVFKWIEKLNKYHSGLFHWHVVPVMNPDGLLPRSAQRTNKNGVDLNRNLPSDDWAENALKYWRDKQGENPRRYPGESPASEPETQWLIDEINEFKPDAIISVHAPYGVVDFDALLLNTAPKSLGKLHLNLLGTYPGSLGNYAGIDRNIPVITLELPHAWEMPSEQETTKIWEDIVSWLRKNVNQELAEAGD